ncbi:MAG TPA: DUF885 domain-containing protein [Candidatus Eisenbergiella merdipullorum]|uniref:DUF885 domain-containing protein n=1 Tax=Candidatus Eisenbergiella merdipullorum TaxID=2838553 RepID=A0A9D2I6H1_9FIRM|nr:DUF885 domain-containing protein [Candidatus Eisenbergiella merdipullorum]
MKKKFPYLFTAVFFLCFAAIFLYFFLNSDARRFRQVTENFFVSSLAGDSLSLHYTLADPSPYLEAPSPASLPVYSREERQAGGAVMENLLSALWKIDPGKLNEQDSHVWSLLVPWLENELAGAQCEYFEEPLSATSGMHIELPVLLAEYTFRNRKDLEDYLDILESIPAYLEGLGQYEKEKAAAGLFMTDEDAAEVVDQCDAILDEALLESGEHFLQTTFAERLDKLIEMGEVDEEERERYLSENDRLLKTVAAPAYETLADTIFLLAGSGLYSEGLGRISGGIVYYTYLLKRNTGSYRTPEEITQLLSEQLQSGIQEIQSLSSRYRQLTGHTPESASIIFAFPFENEQEILEDLQRRMQDDFPPFSALADTSVSCTTKTVSESLEDYTSPAFYLTPPLDDVSENVIYVNPSSTRPGLELYTTLAHEGYPGHLYQTVYSRLYENSMTDDPVHSILPFSGFVEGWAYYVENIAYGYAADVLRENGVSEADQLLVQILCLERNLQINLYCLLDLSIHYYGAKREDVHRTLAAFGISDSDTADAIFDYIRREPTTYLKYYLSYLEILALKEEARTLWQDQYTDLRFHTFLLQAGPADFSNLEKWLKEEPAAPS